MKLTIEDEYRKYPELKKYQNEIEKIIEWIKTQPHLPRLREREILLFLHAQNFQTESTKRVIDLSFTTITHSPEIFSNCDLLKEGLQRAMKTMAIFPLKELTPEGNRVVIGRFADPDVTKFNFNEIVKLFCICFLQVLSEEHLAEGYHLVVDLTGVTIRHIPYLDLLTIKKCLLYLQESAALRVAGIHFVNLVPFMDRLLGLVKPFLSEELANLLYLHPFFDSFHKHIPKNILPLEYEGNDEHGIAMKEKFYKRLLENREFFIEEERLKLVNEKLRPGKAKDASDIFGTEGNFKRLDID